MSVSLDEPIPSRWRPLRGPAPRRVLIDAAAVVPVSTPVLPKSVRRGAAEATRSLRRWLPPALVLGCVIFAGA